jgi:hypothetical protein
VSRRLKQAAVVFIIVFAAAQFVRPERANPATDARRTIQAHVGQRADSLPSWIARATTVTRTRPCGRGTPKSRLCPGGWRRP